MKKFLLLILSFVLGLFVFVGCSETTEDQYEEVETVEYDISYFVVIGDQDAVALTDAYKVDGKSYPTSYEEGDAFYFSPLKDAYTVDEVTYSFKGWYTDSACTTAITGVTASTKNDLTLYAKYEKVVVTYTISYNILFNDDTPAALTNNFKLENGNYPEVYEYGVGATISDLKPTVDMGGVIYEFTGWYLSQTSGTKLTDNTISATNTGNITLYARYESENYTPDLPTEPDEYDINYFVVINGETAIAMMDAYKLQNGNYPASYEYGVGAEISALNTDMSTANGVVVFKGWFTNAECTMAFENISTTNMGEVTIYAKYETVNYNISYFVVVGNADAIALTDSYKVSGGEYPTSYEYGKATEIDDLKEITSGGKTYEFKGWYFDEELTMVASITASTSGDKTLYAKYTVKADKDDNENWTQNY